MDQFTVLLFHKSLGLPQMHGQSFIAFTRSRSTTIKPFDECSIRSTQRYFLSVSFVLSNPSNLRKPRSPSPERRSFTLQALGRPQRRPNVVTLILSPPRERGSFEPRIATLGPDFWTLSSCFCSQRKGGQGSDRNDLEEICIQHSMGGIYSNRSGSWMKKESASSDSSLHTVANGNGKVSYQDIVSASPRSLNKALVISGGVVPAKAG